MIDIKIINTKSNDKKITISRNTLFPQIIQELIIGLMSIIFSFMIFSCINITNVDAKKQEIECSRAITKAQCRVWAYDEVMEQKIFPDRGFLCRKLRWDCFDEAVKNDPWKVNAMNEWWVNKLDGDFFPFLNHFNPKAMEILCMDSEEYLRNISPNICPSILRNCTEGSRNAFLKHCKNPQSLKISDFEYIPILGDKSIVF